MSAAYKTRVIDIRDDPESVAPHVAQDHGTMLEITVNCRLCKKDHKFVVSHDEYNNWARGMHIQYAMPKLSRDNAELLISQICGTCFDNLFKEDDDVKEEDKTEPDNLH